MRRTLAILLALCMSNFSLLEAASSPSNLKSPSQDEQFGYDPFSPEELDNLVAPIALYPDPLLSQVLVAATFVDDVDEAARWVRASGTNGIDDRPWDVSVKAVAHYPTVIAMMANRIDWTTSLGQAYVNQSTDVMTSIQRLRRMARNVGNLVTTTQQQVIVEDDYISIVPYQPQYIYVPVYDPYICYYRRPAWGVAITFGVGFLIGAWLNRDCDWHHHRVYYHGWHGGGWVERCRPRVHINNIYVNNRYENVMVDRRVVHRNVNVNNIRRYDSIHRNVEYRNVQVNNDRVNRRNNVRPINRPPRPPVDNRNLNRNLDTTNPRLDQYRGHEGPAVGGRPPQAPRTQPERKPEPPGRPGRPGVQPPPRTGPPPTARPAPVSPPQPPPHVFGSKEGNFDPRRTSQRGQSSRDQMKQPRSSLRPAPQAHPSPAPRSVPAPKVSPAPRSAPPPKSPGKPTPHGGGAKQP